MESEIRRGWLREWEDDRERQLAAPEQQMEVAREDDHHHHQIEKRNDGNRSMPKIAQANQSTNGQVEPKVYDPFDPEALRVSSMAAIEVEAVLTTVPVRKPKRNEFFRVHPDHVVDMHLLERDSGMEKESYLVAPNVKHLVASELRPVRLFTAITKHGTVFLWPLKLPTGENDHLRRISDSALQGAEQAKTLWTRLTWNRDLGAYDLARAKGDLGEPQWPDKSFRDLIEIAFRNNVIDREDHEVIKELSGEI